MIFNRLAILRGLFRPRFNPETTPLDAQKAAFRQTDREAAKMAERWRRAFADNPELARDLIRLGGILQLPPERLVDGVPQPDPIDPIRLALESGTRSLAIKILATGGITYLELNQMMENQDDL